MEATKNNLEQYETMAHLWWEKNGPFWALAHINAGRFEYFDACVKNWNELNTLDVGCGGGFTCETLAKKGAKVSGIDRAGRLIDVANAHAQAQGLSIAYHKGNGEALPFEEASFDVVTCFDVLEHVYDLARILSEIQRVLKPGGFFFFDTINRTWASRMIVVWLLENVVRLVPKGTHDWTMFITPAELSLALGEAGFKDVATRGLQVRGIDLRKRAPRFKPCGDDSMLYLGKATKAL